MSVLRALATADLAALQYLLREGAPPIAEAVKEAIRQDHLPALQAIHAARWPVNGEEAMLEAALRGHVHIMA
ncbi:hypothetical protein GPECTOR_42g766 [Gonium pectorale]|uniref:Uncharacterized protein n=1 Tax=Gonium pectorale TaxID=33097 RepID=A0A150G9Q0_GONPE|nr:hypothetical protein GPECTOR_42g766 [Gonium pectorale]|eukprot:KXZ46558.1 hypothetical protein GPECTOR_42g766 [Gonium pectorale]